jgi:hypothetical protein
MGKNIQRVSEMLDGSYKNKIQSGYTPDIEPTRKIGDKWTDSDGVEWEQKNGYRMKVNKLPSMGIADNCLECKTYIIKAWDKDTFRYNGRCYHCQLNYELDLKFDKPIRWFAYRRLKDFRNMEAVENEYSQWIDEKEKLDKEKIFDMSVANAMANDNVEMSIKKNTK